MSKSTRVKIVTVGCRANQADSAVLQANLDPKRFSISTDEAADLVVINTCCVTNRAVRDCEKAARRALRDNPETRVVFTGCAVSAFSDFANALGERATVAGGGATNPAAVAHWLGAKDTSLSAGALPATNRDWDYDYFGSSELSDDPTSVVANVDGRTRGLLKIQNGCRHNCTYCIVPTARGPEQSMPPDMVVKKVEALVTAGFNEVVLTGIQLGAWGNDLPGGLALPQLLLELLTVIGPARIRISSIEPWSVDEALLRVMAKSDRICPHLHMPLQSGDDGVLRDMRRGYDASEFLDKVTAARALMPHLALGTDVICGFPTEDEAAFLRTVEVVEKMAPAYLHAFPYSRRTGTIAAKRYSATDRSVAKERVRRLLAVAAPFGAAFRQSRLGQPCQVLVEEAGRGITETYLPVLIEQGKKGDLVTALLGRGPDGKTLVARPC